MKTIPPSTPYRSWEAEIMHIAVIGGTGNVGTHAFRSFYADYAAQQSDKEVHFTLVAKTPARADALERQIRQSIFSTKRRPFDAIQYKSTDQFSQIKGADLVVMLLHVPLSTEAERAILNSGIDHRMTLSYGNKDAVISNSKKIALHAPNAYVLVVTNQSDLMAGLARNFIDPKKVLGFGGMVDSIRLRFWLSEYARDTGREALIDEINKCHVVGYHNNNMTCLEQTVAKLNKLGIPKQIFDEALEQTRSEGFEITQMRTGRTPIAGQVNSPDLVPGVAVARTMLAFSGVIPPIKESFNVSLSNGRAKQWGLTALVTSDGNGKSYGGHALSVPVEIWEGGYGASSIHVSDIEKINFGKMAAAHDASIALLMRPADKANISVIDSSTSLGMPHIPVISGAESEAGLAQVAP